MYYDIAIYIYRLLHVFANDIYRDMKNCPF